MNGNAIVVGAACLVLAQYAGAVPVDSTALQYHGHITRNGAPVTSVCSFRVSAWPGEQGGNALAQTVVNGVAVTVGFFSLEFDFGSVVFSGEERWLSIETQCSGDAQFQLIAPRQRLGAVPYSIHTRGLSVNHSGDVGVGVSEPSAGLDVQRPSSFPGAPLARFESTSGGAQVAIKGHDSDIEWGVASGWIEPDGFYVLQYDGVDTTVPLMIDSGGRIGVGVTAPHPRWAAQFKNVGDQWKGGIIAGGNTANVVMGELNGVATIGAHNASLDAWRSLAINPDGGNVGIGTSTPNSKLDVAGIINVQGIRFPDGTVLTTAAPALYCAPGCPIWYLADLYCDTACNNAQCEFDGGDFSECAPGCRECDIGDGFCDPACDNEPCWFDLFDCE